MADTYKAYKVILKSQDGNYLIPYVDENIYSACDGNGENIAATYLTAEEAESAYLPKDGNAASAVRAGKLTTETVGGTSQPAYIDAGEPKAISATVGSGVKPVFLSGGTFTAISGTAGSGTKHAYLSGGAFTAASGTVGSATRPVWLNAGTFTAVSASGVTAGSYGQGSAQTGTSAKTISVPYITVNAYGYLTGATSNSVYIPASCSDCNDCSNCNCCDNN